jgi:hypothetical protein
LKIDAELIKEKEKWSNLHKEAKTTGKKYDFSTVLFI